MVTEVTIITRRDMNMDHDLITNSSPRMHLLLVFFWGGGMIIQDL